MQPSMHSIKEIEVAKHILEGKGVKRIAWSMGIAERTVKFYVAKIARALEIEKSFHNSHVLCVRIFYVLSYALGRLPGWPEPKLNTASYSLGQATLLPFESIRSTASLKSQNGNWSTKNQSQLQPSQTQE